MKLAVKLAALLAVIAALAALVILVLGEAASTTAIVGSSALALAIGIMAAAWKRSRQRKQLMQMRDSALW